ncbi:MAG: hypothetical protein IJ405_09610 [Lachnospiraceae bacterium]|nr:hypothetical protein [Lachnospiraceae bacterium]MBQ7782265.1 hypothetical protein [Lachnospiraceae bacterium]
MVWILKVLDNIESKIQSKFHFKKWSSMQLLQAGVIGIGIVLLIPLLLVGCYNHMSGDDWYNARFVYHQIMEGSFSIWKMLQDIWADLVDLYTRWSFTYTGYFLCYVMPAGFGEQFTWLHTVILLLGTVAGMYCAFVKMFMRCLSMEKVHARISTILMMILMIQYMPSPFDGFYWWSGSVNNTFGFFISILGLAFFCKLYLDGTVVKTGSWVLLGIGLFLIAGTSYASVLVLLCSMFLVVIDAWLYKKQNKKQRIILSGLLVWFVLCIIFAMTAPGNGVRSDALTELGAIGYSPVKAIIMAYLRGFELIYESINGATLVLIAAVCAVAAPYVIRYRQKCKHPLMVLAVTYSIYITSFIPTLYAQGIAGEPRVRNIQYWYSIICIVINVLYCLGWYLNKKNIDKEARSLVVYKTEIIVVLLACSMVFMLQSEQEPASKSALKGWLIGEVQQFDEELDAREELYRGSRDEEVVAEQLSVIPAIFDGYTDLREATFWINDHVKDYYKLKRVYSSIDGQVVE